MTLKEIVFDMMTQAEKIEHIINKSCTYFGVTRDDLKPHINPKTEYLTNRQFIIKVLTDNTTLSCVSIAKLLGYRQHGTVKYHYNVISDDLSENVYGSDKIKRLYKDYLNYLNL